MRPSSGSSVSGSWSSVTSSSAATMPQPMSTPTAAGITAPLVGITDPTVAPMPTWASGMRATWPSTIGSRAVFSAWRMVPGSMSLAQEMSLSLTLVGMSPPPCCCWCGVAGGSRTRASILGHRAMRCQRRTRTLERSFGDADACHTAVGSSTCRGGPPPGVASKAPTMPGMGEVPSRGELEAAHCWEDEDHVPGRPDVTAFRRAARLHQARWREAKGHPIGTQPIVPPTGRTGAAGRQPAAPRLRPSRPAPTS